MMSDDDFSYNFPFDIPRDNQKEICKHIDKAFNSGKKFVLIQAPTGAGKSVMAYTMANYYAHQNKSSYVLTSQKTLQDQYMGDFSKLDKPHVSMKTVKGEANYICDMDTNKTCDVGVCKTSKKKMICNCPYKVARDETYANKIALLNYTYFLNMSNHTNSIMNDDSGNTGDVIQTKRNLLILDECHNLENELTGFNTLEIDFKEFKANNVIMPKLPSQDDAMEWLFGTFAEFIEHQLEVKTIKISGMKEGSSEFLSENKSLKFVEQIATKLQNIAKCVDKGIEIVVHKDDIYYMYFKPLNISHISDDIFSYADNVIMFSATILNAKQMCSDLGIDIKNALYINIPSSFPIKNRPIYDMSPKIGVLNYNNMEAKKPTIVKYIKAILEKHKNERGIIHTQSYPLAEYIMKELNNDRLFAPKGKNRDIEIKNFLNDPTFTNGVLVSPSLTEGLDLSEDLGRFAIVVKAPFPSLGDPYISSRSQLEPVWYDTNTIRTIIQACGRTVRSPTDKSTTYFLDQAIMNVLKRNLKSIPNYFYDSIKTLEK